MCVDLAKRKFLMHRTVFAPNEQTLERLRPLISKGLHNQAVAKQTGLTTLVVARYRKLLKKEGDYMLTSEEHNKRLALYHQGLNDGEIAERCCISRASIASWRKKFNLPANSGKHLSEDEIKRISELYDAGVSDRQIGKIVGRPSTTILAWRRRNGKPPNKEPISAQKKK